MVEVSDWRVFSREVRRGAEVVERDREMRRCRRDRVSLPFRIRRLQSVNRQLTFSTVVRGRTK